MRRSLLIVALLLASSAVARDKQETWIEVRSPHFDVVTNANEKQGRKIADQFERMRSLFHALFPKLQMDNGSPILVLAIKDEKDFRALEPQAYLAKGSLKLGGLFLRGPEKNYVLMRMDAEGEHPYAVIYHEYTHFLLSRLESIPLWLNEGLAEFYENTDIHEKEAALGQPSGSDILWLRQNRLLPLTTLLAVDHNSPYYHEENKGSIFYAESWALTHYLQVGDFSHKTQRITDYLNLISQHVDPTTAASQAFGDLKKLQDELDRYVHGGNYQYFKVITKTEVDDSSFKAQTLTPLQADAMRADFLAYNDRTSDAEALLSQVLQQDPKNVSAHETSGYIEFRKGHLDQAKKWFGEAVQLDSQSYLAHYYFAAMSINRGGDDDEAAIENSLRTATKLNPSFAPAFDLLAVQLGRQHKNLEEARMMELAAIGLDPGNIRYRVNVANVLVQMQQTQQAIQVLQQAAKLAKSPAEEQMVENFLMHTQEYASALAEQAERQKQNQELAHVSEKEEDSDASGTFVPKLEHRDTFVEKGPHRFLVGVLKDIHCTAPELDLTVASKVKTLTLHAQNYYKVQFTALNFAPSDNLNPCKDLEGRPAKVEYVESADPSVAPRVLSVELHK